MTGDGIVLRGGRIYRPGTATSAPGGVAIQDGRIAAVGGEDELAGFAAGGARVVDVSGGLVLPGFQDTHVHPNIAGLVERGLDLTELASREEILAAVAAWAAAAPADAWISGWGWGQHLFGPQGPTRGELDAVAGGRPTVLTRGDGHAGWANTAALEAAGLLRPAPDLAGGEVVRGDDGLATGLLQEEAVGRVTGLVGEPTWDQRRTALLTAQAKLLGFGITGWQDASVSPDDARLYAELADSGELAATVIGALRWQDSRGLEQAAELEETRRAWARPRFRPTAVKILYDGVVDGSLTAAVLEPYLDASGAPTANRGLSFFGAEEVVEIVDAITRAGFQTHFHALGDRAVREALDAVEAVARRLGGDAIARLRPILSHIQLVDPADMGRFAALGAVASAQPYWAVMDAVQTDLTLPFIGPGRGALQYPFGDLWRAGARLAGGSDWPVSTPDPIQGVHTAVNRSLPGPAGAAGRLGPAQALTLAQALTAYTLGSAFANHREDESGALEVGLAGDLAVLDRDPFAAPPESIGQARVAMTLIDGRVVHQL